MIDFGFPVKLDILRDREKPLAWRNDRRIWEWCRQRDLINEASHNNWFEGVQKDPTIRMYAVMLKDEQVGVCGLTSIDQANQRAEFSLYIDPERQGQGLGKACLSTLLSHGFLNLNLNLIWGESFRGNPAMEIFDKLGFKRDGTRRDFYYKNGEFIDAHLVSIRRKEWEKFNSP